MTLADDAYRAQVESLARRLGLYIEVKDAAEELGRLVSETHAAEFHIPLARLFDAILAIR